MKRKPWSLCKKPANTNGFLRPWLQLTACLLQDLQELEAPNEFALALAPEDDPGDPEAPGEELAELTEIETEPDTESEENVCAGADIHRSIEPYQAK